METDILLLLGRILFGGFFVFNGLNHLFKHGAITGYAASKNVPQAGLAVTLSGLMILFGGLGVLLGAYINLAVLLLVIFLLVVSIKVHNFWAVADPTQKMLEMVNFTKNLALLGAALMLLYIPQPWPLSLGY